MVRVSLRLIQELKTISQAYKDNDTFPADSGKLACNKKKNRFKDILPCEMKDEVEWGAGGVGRGAGGVEWGAGGMEWGAGGVGWVLVGWGGVECMLVEWSEVLVGWGAGGVGWGAGAGMHVE